ncbi:MAG: hypothetical protein CMP22_04335 [Rickettsiales bacterium]|nr:hypothetical protein [Rickettsiales bacterium]|tara:strand:+ start:106 stop:648 length:543 start_codon:yes stop_codon:yes gene_type:complete
MKIIIDANLPNLSVDVIDFLKSEYGVEEIKKIYVDTKDDVIYREAKKDNFDFIITRDDDFEPFIENDLRLSKNEDKARGIPRIIFFAKNNGMQQDELEKFMLLNIATLKRLSGVINNNGHKARQYFTCQSDTSEPNTSKPDIFSKILKEEKADILQRFEAFKQNRSPSKKRASAKRKVAP